jgi:hypothetical protein
VVPDSVRHAKRLIGAMKNKADISDGEEDDEEEVPSGVQQEACAQIIGKTKKLVPFTIRVPFVTLTQTTNQILVSKHR